MRIRPEHTRKTILALATGLVALVTAAGTAAMPIVVNPGFEDITGELQQGEFTFGPLNGWELYDPGAITGGGQGPTFFIGTLSPTPPDFFTAGGFAAASAVVEGIKKAGGTDTEK